MRRGVVPLDGGLGLGDKWPRGGGLLLQAAHEPGGVRHVRLGAELGGTGWIRVVRHGCEAIVHRVAGLAGDELAVRGIPGGDDRALQQHCPP